MRSCLLVNMPPTPEDVVANIKAPPRVATNIRPATGSLRDALLNAPVDPDFDVASWEEAWREIENWKTI